MRDNILISNAVLCRKWNAILTPTPLHLPIIVEKRKRKKKMYASHLRKKVCSRTSLALPMK